MTSKTTAKTESASPASESTQDVTLEEFCQRLSMADKRVELIGGFYANEKRAGRFKDADAAYAGRFQKFVNKPV